MIFSSKFYFCFLLIFFSVCVEVAFFVVAQDEKEINAIENNNSPIFDFTLILIYFPFFKIYLILYGNCKIYNKLSLNILLFFFYIDRIRE